jgi:type IV fimbrial biogenesis protein FimT
MFREEARQSAALIFTPMPLPTKPSGKRNLAPSGSIAPTPFPDRTPARRDLNAPGEATKQPGQRHAAHILGGFSLIELLLTITIAAIILVMAVPSYAIWIADLQISAAANSIANGLRYARSEAIKRNAPVKFVLDPTTATGGWIVSAPNGSIAQRASFSEGSAMVGFSTSGGKDGGPAAAGGSTVVTFTGLGMILQADPDPRATMTGVDVTHTTLSKVDTRWLTVLVGAGRADIKVCDPKWTVINPLDPKACPPAP